MSSPEEAPDRAKGPYVESPIIMTTTRVIAPFVFIFGLFVMFHGADSSGGGFQGGVIVATMVLMLGIGFGIESTRDWIGPYLPVLIAGIGVFVFLIIGLGSIIAGGAFLEYHAYPVPKSSKLGIELVELAIGFIVAGIVVGLLFALGAGIRDVEGEE